jgi:DnaJ-class molecular chaperone
VQAIRGGFENVSQRRTTRQHDPLGLSGSLQDHYERLGVSETASPEQIKRAYRAAMKRIHPDRVGQAERAVAEDEAKRVNLAFRVLSNPESRRQYDSERRVEAVQEQIMGRYFGGMTPGGNNDLYEQIRAAARAEQRAQQRQHDRGAMLSLLLVFGGLLFVSVLLVVLWGVLSSLADRFF